jgi:hypothetical protein
MRPTIDFSAVQIEIAMSLNPARTSTKRTVTSRAKSGTKQPRPSTQTVQKPEHGHEHPPGVPVEPVTREERVRFAAYLRAERRGFIPGRELEDWLQAEKEVDQAITIDLPVGFSG